MAKQRGNPAWGKPDPHTARNNGPTSFEEIVRELRLSPADYQYSIQLKAWVLKNKDQKYVPSDLLRAWDFEVKGDL
ncbi:MAG: hypothetical protein WB660_26875 [Candidatus Sulfotelmatobacter sp.]